MVVHSSEEIPCSDGDNLPNTSHSDYNECGDSVADILLEWTLE